jgi:two-component system sensor histidine kinase KdpD
MIEREADRLNHLVGNILDMSRIEGGALKLEKELYPLQDVVYYVVDHMRFLLKEREVRLSVPDDIPPVELDFLHIDQVLTNLIENAVRYTPSSSPIEICAEVRGNEVVVSVADYGLGIPVQAMEHVFDKFYRVMETRRKDVMGTGLGLAVCRGLIEAHGGRIWVENREEGGAVFRFTLPLQAVQETREIVYGSYGA